MKNAPIVKRKAQKFSGKIATDVTSWSQEEQDMWQDAQSVDMEKSLGVMSEKERQFYIRLIGKI